MAGPAYVTKLELIKILYDRGYAVELTEVIRLQHRSDMPRQYKMYMRAGLYAVPICSTILIGDRNPSSPKELRRYATRHPDVVTLVVRPNYIGDCVETRKPRSRVG